MFLCDLVMKKQTVTLDYSTHDQGSITEIL